MDATKIYFDGELHVYGFNSIDELRKITDSMFGKECFINCKDEKTKRATLSFNDVSSFEYNYFDNFVDKATSLNWHISGKIDFSGANYGRLIFKGNDIRMFSLEETIIMDATDEQLIKELGNRGYEVQLALPFR